MIRLLLAFAIAVSTVSAVAAQSVLMDLMAYPDLVLINGQGLTIDARFAVAEAVAVRNGRILAVGSSAEIRRLIGPRTRTIDLAGRSVVPGFIDSSGDNAFADGDLYKDTRVNGRILPQVRADSVPAMLNQVRALVRDAAPGSLVFVRMADEFLNQLAKLTTKDLDAIAPDNPLMLCLTTDSVVNTRMLERAFAAGLPRDHFGVVKDANGKPTGQLFSSASGIVGWNLRDWPELTDAIFTEQEKINAAFLRAAVESPHRPR